MAEIELKSTIDVSYVDHMGSDERIVEAMLVSTKGLDAKEAAKESVRGRLNYLMKNRHGTPFECGALTIRVHAPIKVWREWHRHRVGFSYNEQSGRYTPFAPVFWLPPIERAMIEPQHFKSSSPVFITPTEGQYDKIRYELKTGYSNAFDAYQRMLEMGVDKGLARDVLGVGIFSACYVTANPRSFMHFMELRTNRPDAKRPSKPLWEIDNAAQQVEAIFQSLWPITHELWNQHGRQAP
jgi:thymidylate synthase (FAD)